ncbi:hypothetical protein [Vibrio sp. R78045]|uniref:hypothetical protein n=1 Tax=Vibrio sp. R78045 TaxID=3093868 RepID=UPI0036F32209
MKFVTRFCPKPSQAEFLPVALSNSKVSGGRHLLPSAASLRTQRATFTALGSSLHEGIV